MTFTWENISKGLAKELARSAGLRVSFAAEDLSQKFGKLPTDEAVQALWPTLRDRWLATRPKARDQVVSELRKAGLGDTSIRIGSKTGQMAYLRSCRISSSLKAVVLAALHEEGSQPMMPPSIMVETHPGEVRTQTQQQQLTALQVRVVAILTEVLGQPPGFDEDGDIGIARGSSGIYLRALEKDVPTSMIRIAGTLVADVQSSHQLLEDLNEANQSLLFVRLMHVDGMVVLNGHIPAENLTVGELSFLLNEALMAADHFDTLFASRHGGSLMGSDQGEVVDA